MFLRQSNDLNRQIAKVQSDLDSYYLIGFSPAPDSPSRQGAPFHTIRILAKRRDLQARSRRGFVGLPESLPGPEPEPAGTRQLIHAVFTPFVKSQAPVALNTMYTYSAKNANVQNFGFVEPRRLHLAQQPDGSHAGTLELAVFAFRPDGETAAHVPARAPVTLNAAQYAVALQKGIVYGFNFNLPPGVTYQVRAAVLARGSGQLGSANQVLVVPDWKKGRVALSSLELAPIDKSNPQSGEQLSRGFLTHRFRPDAVPGYRCAVFNARTDPASQQAALIAQPLIYRDARLGHGQARPRLPARRLFSRASGDRFPATRQEDPYSRRLVRLHHRAARSPRRPGPPELAAGRGAQRQSRWAYLTATCVRPGVNVLSFPRA